jgi:excisionase family DNA binding protein
VHDISVDSRDAFTIYKWIERKKLPAHKVGRLWKFMASEVDDWVRAGKVGADTGGAK